MYRQGDPGESEFSTARSGGRKAPRPGYRQQTPVTPPLTTGVEYRGAEATETLAEAVESQARLLTGRTLTAPKRKPVRRAQ